MYEVCSSEAHTESEKPGQNELSSLRTGSYSLAGLVFTSATAVLGFEASDLLLIQKGPVALKPQFQVTGIYDDNPTYRDEDKEGDFRAVISPGLTLQAGDRTLNYLELTYFYDRVEYLDLTELNANQHRVDFVSHFQKRRFTMDGRDSYQHLVSPLSGGISIGGQKVARDVWDDAYHFGYEISDRTVIYFEPVHTTVNYESGVNLYDSFNLSATVGFEYKAFSRTSFFGEVYYGRTKNDVNTDLMPQYPTTEYVGAFVGARGNFTEKLTGTVKGGYEYRWYRNDPEDLHAPVVEISLTERFTENTAVTAGFSRRVRESVQYVRSSYVASTIFATLLQNIGSDGRLRAGLDARYISAAYEDNPAYVVGDRRDDIVFVGLTITYDIKLWLRAFAGYNFEYLESNEPTVIDYLVNRFTLGLQLGY